MPASWLRRRISFGLATVVQGAVRSPAVPAWVWQSITGIFRAGPAGPSDAAGDAAADAAKPPMPRRTPRLEQPGMLAMLTPPGPLYHECRPLAKRVITQERFPLRFLRWNAGPSRIEVLGYGSTGCHSAATCDCS